MVKARKLRGDVRIIRVINDEEFSAEGVTPPGIHQRENTRSDSSTRGCLAVFIP